MRRTAAALLAVLAAVPAAASGPELHGHAKLELDARFFRDDDLGALLAGTTAEDGRLDLRLDTVWRRSRWDLKVDTQLLALDGDTVRAAASPLAEGLGGTLLGVPSPSDERQWLDLSHTFTSSGSRLVFARLDRFSVGYTGDRFVARLGRQALSWGGGLVFQVLDLFNPFPPTVVDTDYKPGTDMLSTQWLLSSGDDLQAIVVPRRAAAGRAVTGGESSAAAKWHHFAGAAELELLAASHYDDTVTGAGLSGNLLGGVWRVNATYTDLDRGGGTASFLANLDHSWVWGGRNAYGFVEVFHNGFGVGDLDGDAPRLPEPLLERLARGELFNLGRDELAAGLQFEWSPLLRLDPTVIVNLRDGSSMLLLRLGYDWLENLRLDAGLQAGVGPRGTEYGGVSFPPAYAAPGRLAWIRLSRYF